MANERLQGLLGGQDPLFNIGMGILANNYGNYGAFGPALGRGFQQGMQQTQEAKRFAQQTKQDEMRQKMYELQMQEALRKQASERAYGEALNKAFTPQQVPNMSFMDANQQAMQSPDQQVPGYQWNQPPAFDRQAMLNAVLQNPDIEGSQKFATYQALMKPEQEEFTLTPGQKRFRGGREIASVPGAPEAPKSRTVRMGGEEVTQEFNPQTMKWEEIGRGAAFNPNAGVSVTYGAPVAGIDASGNPVFFQPTKGGGAPSIVPGVRPEPKPEKAPTEMQAKAGTFFSQMRSASNDLGTLAREGFDPTKLSTQAQTGLAGGMTNPLASPSAQRARQAQEQWAESFLRVKTGAAATADEVSRNIRTFFPQVGDSPAVITQKARARQQAEQDVLSMASPSAQQAAQPTAPASAQKTIVKTGMYGGRKVVKYSDGTTAYAD